MNDHLFSSSPRGIRNNNWLNIKFNPRNSWKGQAGNDGFFCIFFDPVFGIRAAYKILKSYLKRTPDMKLKDFIYTWSSTDQEAYLQFVVRRSQLMPWTSMLGLSFNQLVRLFRSMAVFENGLSFDSTFDDDLILRGICMK